MVTLIRESWLLIMETRLPTDCGNAPRITIVGDFITSWAEGDTDAVTAWLAEDVTWTVVGKAAYSGERVADRVCPAISPAYLEVTSIITHGRLASCDGFLESEAGRIDFSHVFRFASTAKTARIRDVRSYCIDHPT